MRILVWHGWLLGGAGSNVYTARTVEIWRRQGHDVLLLCQERRVEKQGFFDAHGASDDLDRLEPLTGEPAAGRAILIRPAIGDLLPVFVHDAYEGFRVKRFVDLSDEELARYLKANVAAVRAAAEWHRSEVAVVGHAFPGGVVGARALQGIPYVVKVHGSDIEYAIRSQERYRELTREGLHRAAAVAGASRDVLERLAELVPHPGGRARVVPPGVESGRFRPAERRASLRWAAEDLATAGDDGRTPAIDEEVATALRRRDLPALDALANRYDQAAPDAAAPRKLRALADHEGPLVGYLGKLIPQKGVEHLIAALALVPWARGVIVGYGTFREWLEALATALDHADEDLVRLLGDRMPLSLTPTEVTGARGLQDRLTFTGRLDHDHAPAVVAACDVLAVPSVLDEAFGMVAIEGAAAGALPLVARHSGLAEIAAALEEEAGRPGLFSYAPGPDPVRNLVAGLGRLFGVPADERRELALGLAAFAATRWGWQRTADALLASVRGGS
ncbi:MAG TPA: glycosyltransferase [Actinomycetota bacterium]|nr:glycosyltransferase [Actinomycetota bacterium]